MQDRQHIGIHHRRRGPLILPHLRQHRDRRGNGQVGESFAQQRIGTAFVGRIAVAVDEADGDGFDALSDQICRGRKQSVLIKGQNDTTVGSNTFRHLPAQPAGHQGHWFVPLQIEHIRRTNPANFKDIAKALGCDQSRAGTALL